jgi:hypothetical protein
LNSMKITGYSDHVYFIQENAVPSPTNGYV